eukprot:10701369-Prorocentrum_lima.AAC.1
MTSSLVGWDVYKRQTNKKVLHKASAALSKGRRQGDIEVRPLSMKKAVSYTHLTLPTICSV